MALSIARGPIALGELYFTLNAAQISNFFFYGQRNFKVVFFFAVYGRGTFKKENLYRFARIWLAKWLPSVQ